MELSGDLLKKCCSQSDGKPKGIGSAEELQLLKTNCELPTVELAKLFPHRQKRAVINKRYKLQWNPQHQNGHRLKPKPFNNMLGQAIDNR